MKHKKTYANRHKRRARGNAWQFKRTTAYRRNQRLRLPRFRPQVFTRQLWEGTQAAGTLALVIIGSEWVNRQVERMFPQVSVGPPNIMLKIGTAAVVIWGSQQLVRQPMLRNVALAGAAYPLFVEGVAAFAPQLAAQIPSIAVAAAPIAALPAPRPTMGADYDELGTLPGSRISDAGTMGAELDLAAELEQESDLSTY